MRGRGLKHTMLAAKPPAMAVAPHAGAWIETHDARRPAARPGLVAPHAGAWIETHELDERKSCVSRPPCGGVD